MPDKTAFSMDQLLRCNSGSCRVGKNGAQRDVTEVH